MQVNVWDPRWDKDVPRWCCDTLAELRQMRAEAEALHPNIVPAPLLADDYDSPVGGARCCRA